MDKTPIHELEKMAHYWVPEEEESDYPFIPYFISDIKQFRSTPNVDNMELIQCQTCETQTAVNPKDNVKSYTCSTCYSAPKL